MDEETWDGYSGAGIMDRLLRDAADADASDLHIEPGPDDVCVRLRVDGKLQVHCHLPSAIASSISVRCKVIGRMDVTEKRLPQDGSCPTDLNGRRCDLRISVLPTIYGETIVIRLLFSSLSFIESGNLGMEPEQIKTFRRYLLRQSGLILATGPTGSGKSSTLYAALHSISSQSISIISIEDPVEYRIPGVSQIGVNEKTGLTFASGLRSLVRQDPDVIMVGEIRDRETAEIAIHAALTGHLVLSSLHTVNAAQAPLRLIDMGIAPYLAAAALTLVISQRLVRILCPSCHVPFSPEESHPDTLFHDSAAEYTLYHSGTCPSCRNGYIGRSGVFEFLEITAEAREIIVSGGNVDSLFRLMKKQGQISMSDAARLRMLRGEISPEEAYRIFIWKDEL